jgi:predicted 2-oxoglutarate/Fe(II)-dependent dioxygenase YbiX
MAVLIKENYVAVEDCLRYRAFLDQYVKETPREGIAGALGYPTSLAASTVSGETGVVFGINEPVNFELGSLYEKIKKDAEDYFSQELDLCQSNYQLMTKGGKNPLHADSINLDGTPIQPDGKPEEIEFSGLLYLSNHEEEFEGGILTFPNFDLTYPPKMGDLVLFKGDVEHQHDVSLVTSGERRNIVFFWARRGNVSDDRGYFEY